MSRFLRDVILKDSKVSKWASWPAIWLAKWLAKLAGQMAGESGLATWLPMAGNGRPKGGPWLTMAAMASYSWPSLAMLSHLADRSWLVMACPGWL